MSTSCPDPSDFCLYHAACKKAYDQPARVKVKYRQCEEGEDIMQGFNIGVLSLLSFVSSALAHLVRTPSLISHGIPPAPPSLSQQPVTTRDVL